VRTAVDICGTRTTQLLVRKGILIQTGQQIAEISPKDHYTIT